MRAVTVLAYHAIGDCPSGDRRHRCVCVPTATFADQMAFLARYRRVVALEDLWRPRPPSPRRAVAITFDDGYRNILTNAAPILQHYGFHATAFVPTKWIGRVNAWDAGRDCFPLPLMDEDELREVERRGICVESHGHAHADLSNLDPSLVTLDLSQSIQRLTEVIGRRPRYLAYPYGAQSVETRRVARTVGFEDAFLFDDLELGPYGRERVSVDGYESSFRLWLKTSGRYLARRRSPLGTAGASLIRRMRRRPVYN